MAISNITTDPISNISRCFGIPHCQNPIVFVFLSFIIWISSIRSRTSRNGGEWKVLSDRYRLDWRHAWAALADTHGVFSELRSPRVGNLFKNLVVAGGISTSPAGGAHLSRALLPPYRLILFGRTVQRGIPVRNIKTDTLSCTRLWDI